MKVLIILVPFVLAGLIVIFIAFSGGPAAAREAYMTGGRRSFRVWIPLLYIGLGLAVPAAVIAARQQAQGGVGNLREESLSTKQERGKVLFQHTCASCHTLAAVNARGVTGPDLDDIGQVTKQRVLNAIRIGGTGSGRMPPGLLQGQDAQNVAAYVSQVAGK